MTMARSLARATVSRPDGGRGLDRKRTEGKEGAGEGGKDAAGNGDEAGAGGKTSVLTALSDNVPTDLVTFYAGVFAILNATSYAEYGEWRSGLLLAGVICAALHFADERRKADSSATFGSTFHGKAGVALVLLLTTFTLWALIAMSGKQDSLFNAVVLLLGAVWAFALPKIRNLSGM